MSLVDKIIKIAKGEVGTHEGRSGGHWNNIVKYAPAVPGLEWAQGEAWCATFVSWVALEAGAEDLYPRTASCDVAAKWFKDRGRLSEYPAIGAQVFYGSSRDYVHTGIVYDYDDTYIYTIEGNTNDNGSREGDGVYEKKRRRRDSYTAAYGYPKFPEGIVSADPKFADELPKAESKPKPKPTPKPKPQPKPVEKPVPATPQKEQGNPRVVALKPAVKPGATHPQVAVLQDCLRKLGYMDKGKRSTDFYGPVTQAAVAAWHNDNTRFKASGVKKDRAIGPKGFVALQRQAGRR